MAPVTRHPARMWHVTVQNMESLTGEALIDPYGRIVCKFTLSSMEGLTVDQFETAMCMELTNAIRKIKAEMIMKGIEP